MERAEQAARELREGLDKVRRVVSDHRNRMSRVPTGEEPADDTAGDAAIAEGEGRP